MKRCLILLLAGGLLPGLLWASVLQPEQEKWIQNHLESGDLMGLVIANINNGAITYRAFGRISVADPRAPSATSQFEIGSISKVFTNLLLAEMVAKGALEYTTTLAELLPDLEFGNPAVGRITLLELATHSSGLPRLPANMTQANPADPYADYDAKALLEALTTVRMDQKLSKTYSYSNFGVGLLGYLLGRVDGRGYFQALKAYVLTPLGMKNTTMKDTAALVPGHRDGKLTANWHFKALAGAGALRSSALELTRLFSPWLSPQDAVLKHNAAADLAVINPQRDAGAVTEVWHTAGEGKARVYWHNGGTGGYRSYAGFNPTSREAWIVLSNTDFEIDGFARQLVSLPRIQARSTPLESADNLSEYQGYFAVTPDFVLHVFEQQGELQVQATGQPAFRIAASGKDEFSLLAVDASLVFARDESGTINRLVLHQNGQALPAERVEAAAGKKTLVEIKLEPAALKEFTGTYQLAPGARFKVRVRKGRLMIRLAAQPWLPVFPFAADHFFYKVVDAQLSFNRTDGKIVSLTLHQNGQDQVAPKL